MCLITSNVMSSLRQESQVSQTSAGLNVKRYSPVAPSDEVQRGTGHNVPTATPPVPHTTKVLVPVSLLTDQ